MSFGEGTGIEFDTARGRDWPSVRQFNVFLENRIGALMDLVRRFEVTDVRIVSLTVVDSADCAIIRMVLSDPERALEIFQQGKMMVTESNLLVVKLPSGRQPLATICKALLTAEEMNVERPLGTVFLSRQGRKLEITDESKIPTKYWKEQPLQLDRKALTTDLKEGKNPPGARLVTPNEYSITISGR